MSVSRIVSWRAGEPVDVPGEWPWSDRRWVHTGHETWNGSEWEPHVQPHPDNTDAWRMILRRLIEDEHSGKAEADFMSLWFRGTP